MRTMLAAGLCAMTLAACVGPELAAYEGDCLNISDLGPEVTEFPAVNCDDPHEAEVYATFNLEFEGDYVESAIMAAAQAECIDRFERFVGSLWDESALDIYYLYPQPEGWAQGSRETVCAVIAPNPDTGELELVTGTLQSSER